MNKIYNIPVNITGSTPRGSQPQKSIHNIQDLMEWSARICYRSVGQLGKNPDFMQKIISSGHLDILEHGYFGINVPVPNLETSDLLYFHYVMSEKFPFMETKLNFSEKTVELRSNMRVWLEMANDSYEHLWGVFTPKEVQEIILTLHFLAPGVFPKPRSLSSNYLDNTLGGQIRREIAGVMDNAPIIAPQITDTNACVVMLARTPIDTTDYHATFQLSGVSRALTHQIVRHRKLSFSQASQRYIDNSQFQYVLPHTVNKESETLIKGLMSHINEVYRELRSGKLLKEDARCVLPNAAMTELVVSGNKRGWEHFIKLRTASDAQYEIRQVALAIKDMLKGE